MTFDELIIKYPEHAEAARERLDIMVIEGLSEAEAQIFIARDYKIRFGLLEQRELFDEVNSPQNQSAQKLIETHKITLGKAPDRNWWSE
jgi:hypothetical protein